MSVLPLLMIGGLHWKAGNLHHLWYVPQQMPMRVLPALAAALACHDFIAARGRRVRWPVLVLLLLVFPILLSATHGWAVRQLFYYAQAEDWSNVEIFRAYRLVEMCVLPLGVAFGTSSAVLLSALRTRAASTPCVDTAFGHTVLAVVVGLWVGAWWVLRMGELVRPLESPLLLDDLERTLRAYVSVGQAAWGGVLTVSILYGMKWSRSRSLAAPRVGWAVLAGAVGSAWALAILWRLPSHMWLLGLGFSTLMPSVATLVYASRPGARQGDMRVTGGTV